MSARRFTAEELATIRNRSIVEVYGEHGSWLELRGDCGLLLLHAEAIEAELAAYKTLLDQVAARNNATADERDRLREALTLADALTEQEQDSGMFTPTCDWCGSSTGTPDGQSLVHEPTCTWWRFRQMCAALRREVVR